MLYRQWKRLVEFKTVAINYQGSIERQFQPFRPFRSLDDQLYFASSSFPFTNDCDIQVAVAVKTLKVGSTVEEKLDFLSEAEMMKRFNHKNIVRLLGVCTRNEPVYTVMEFILYGKKKSFPLFWNFHKQAASFKKNIHSTISIDVVINN